MTGWRSRCGSRCPGDDDHEVTCGIHDDGCHIRVIDRGSGFDAGELLTDH